MEIGEQHGDFDPRCLEVDQFVDRDKVAEVDLPARLVAGLDTFNRFLEKRPEIVIGDDFDSVSGNTLVCVH